MSSYVKANHDADAARVIALVDPPLRFLLPTHHHAALLGVAKSAHSSTLPKRNNFPDFLASSIDREQAMTDRRRQQLLTTTEAAEELRLKKHTLENMRWQGTGPPFRKHGGRVFYHRADLKKWSEQTRRRSSSGEKL